MLAQGPARRKGALAMSLWKPLLALLVVIPLALGCDEVDDQPTNTRTATSTASPTSLPTVTRTPTPGDITTAAGLEPGAVAEADGVRVTLLQVTDPWEAFAEADTPEEGYRYVQAAVTLENRSGEDITTGFGAFAFVSGDGTASRGKRVEGAEPYLITQTIADEAVVQGLVVGEVKEGEAFSGLMFDPQNATPQRVVFGEEATEDEPTPTRTPRPRRTPTPGG